MFFRAQASASSEPLSSREFVWWNNLGRKAMSHSQRGLAQDGSHGPSAHGLLVPTGSDPIIKFPPFVSAKAIQMGCSASSLQ